MAKKENKLNEVIYLSAPIVMWNGKNIIQDEKDIDENTKSYATSDYIFNKNFKLDDLIKEKTKEGFIVGIYEEGNDYARLAFLPENE